MIDTILCRRSAGRFAADNAPYRPDMAFTLPSPLNPEADRLAVIFGPWNGGGRVVEAFASRLAFKGYAVQTILMHNKVLSANTSQVAESFACIRQSLAPALDRQIESRRYRQLWGVGISLGNVALSAVASDISHSFDRVSMAVPGASLARSVWYGQRTQDLRLAIEANGQNLADLEASWADIEPVTHVEAFSNVPLKMLISNNDSIIPTAEQEALRNALDEAGANLTANYTPAGHYMAVGQFCLTAY